MVSIAYVSVKARLGIDLRLILNILLQKKPTAAQIVANKLITPGAHAPTHRLVFLPGRSCALPVARAAAALKDKAAPGLAITWHLPVAFLGCL